MGCSENIYPEPGESGSHCPMQFLDILLDLGIPGDMTIAGNWDGMP
jgi:hypothetical protein